MFTIVLTTCQFCERFLTAKKSFNHQYVVITRCKFYAGTPTTSIPLCTSRRRGSWCWAAATTTRPSFGRIASVSPLSISTLLSCPSPGISRTLARWNFDGYQPTSTACVCSRCWLARNQGWFLCWTPPHWHQSSLLTVVPPPSSPPLGLKLPFNFQF